MPVRPRSGRILLVRPADRRRTIRPGPGDGRIPPLSGDGRPGPRRTGGLRDVLHQPLRPAWIEIPALRLPIRFCPRRTFPGGCRRQAHAIGSESPCGFSRSLSAVRGPGRDADPNRSGPAPGNRPEDGRTAPVCIRPGSRRKGLDISHRPHAGKHGGILHNVADMSSIPADNVRRGRRAQPLFSRFRHPDGVRPEGEKPGGGMAARFRGFLPAADRRRAFRRTHLHRHGLRRRTLRPHRPRTGCLLPRHPFQGMRNHRRLAAALHPRRTVHPRRVRRLHVLHGERPRRRNLRPHLGPFRPYSRQNADGCGARHRRRHGGQPPLRTRRLHHGAADAHGSRRMDRDGSHPGRDRPCMGRIADPDGLQPPMDILPPRIGRRRAARAGAPETQKTEKTEKTG